SNPLLVGQVQSRILGEEAAGGEFETRTVDGHYGPIFWPWGVRNSHRVPDNDIAILDRASGLSPNGQAVVTFALIDIKACSMHFRRIIGSDPQVSTNETGPFSYPGVRPGERQRVLTGNDSISHGLARRVCFRRVNDLPLTAGRQIDQSLGLPLVSQQC